MSQRRPLSALDRVFLAAETRASMMHVGGLLIFSPPEGAGRDVPRRLRDEFRRGPSVEPPWNLKLRHPKLLVSPFQAWIPDPHLDLSYHVRRSALASPGDERELGMLVSRLHSTSLDLERPPWEAHLIEGLEGGRFALYVKVHHALVDGYTGMRLLMGALSPDPNENETPMFFSRRLPERPPRPQADEPSAPAFATVVAAIREQLAISSDVGHALLARSRRSGDAPFVSPLQAPKSILNQSVTRSRRFATQQLSIERLKVVAKAHDGTLNDVVLAVCASGLRRFLAEQNALPAEPLTAMIPVNIRPKDDPGGGGNAIGAILASLATDEADPVQRLHTIIASTRTAKEQLQGMSRDAILQYSGLLLLPLMASLIPGSAGRVRPAFNVVISNVPGPDTPQYFRGWRLDAAYPLSIPFNGYALNITVESCAGSLGIGFIGCRDALPHLQHLAVYTGEALRELEEAKSG